jgi:signal recognition particle GTPase
MITLFGQHGVKDFEAWKRGAEANMSNQDRNAQMGIVESSMYRMADGSGVIVTHKFNDLETAQNYKKFMESAESKTMLEQMGAKLPLTIWIAEEM